MPNPGDFDPAFDPAEFIRQQRAAEEAEKQRVQEQADLRRANELKVLRYAEQQLEDIRNPVVSEFVVTERWWTIERISGKRAPQLRANQRISATEDVGSFFRPRYIFTVTTEYERQTRYYSSWLLLRCLFVSHGYDLEGIDTREGLVKLRQPHAGYAYVSTDGWDPRNVGNFAIDLTDVGGREISNPSNSLDKYFRIFASLEEATETYLGPSVEKLTKDVTQALDFVVTGQPPKPTKPEEYW